MRTFIAVDIGPDVRAALRRFQRRLRDKSGLDRPDVKWVEPDNIHLTLKFLGEVRDAHIADLCNAVTGVCENFETFELIFENFGTFGRPPRVLSCGLRESAELVKLQREIENSVAELGFEPEKRKFSAHLTLCRIKSAKAGRIISKCLEEVKNEVFGTAYVESVSIYKSELTNAGPLYTLMANGMLKKVIS